MYPDQVIDRKTVGIPLDVELARDQVESWREETQSLRDEAARWRDQAVEAAHAAEEAGKRLEAFVTAGRGVFVSDVEPTVYRDGTVWLKLDADGRIRWILVFDSTLAGGLYPSESTYPMSDVFPRPAGDWRSFDIAGALVTD